MAQEGAQANNNNKKGGKKGGKLQLNFSELDDLFLSDKGKKLRNLQKKLDKVAELEKRQKDEPDWKPNQD